MEREFIRVRSAKDIVISSLILVSGCILTVVPASAAANIGGVFLIITGFILILVLKTAYKDSASGEIFSKKERFFSQEMHEKLKAALTCPKKLDLGGEDNGSTLRLDVYYNNSKVYVQLFEYVPHTYEPCSPIIEHDRAQGTAFISK